jgi:excisionase family DNA binding protein
MVLNLAGLLWGWKKTVISVSAASERLGVNRMTVQKAIRDGVIEAQKVEGRWQVNEDTLKNYRRKQRRRAER